MKTCRFEVLNLEEIQQIHAAFMEELATIGENVDYSVARQIFAQAGARVDKTNQSVRIPEALVMQAIEKAPKSSRLYGANGKFSVEVGSGQPVFAAIGTPTTPRQKASIREWAGAGIVRASIGLENPNDLINDLDQALCGCSARDMVSQLAG
jgi:trimethylamine:corrinoid methyltransferase-like protein